MKECPNQKCNALFQSYDDIFCYNCGTKLAEAKSYKCGKELNPIDKFCPKCGKFNKRTFKGGDA